MNDAPHTEGGESGTVHSDSTGSDARHAKGKGKHSGHVPEPASPPMSGMNLIDPVTGKGKKE